MATQWYKANLHSHTSGSDGRLPPGEVALNYRRNGYQVLAITDHNVVTPCRAYCAPDFLCLEGTEIGVGKSETGAGKSKRRGGAVFRHIRVAALGQCAQLLGNLLRGNAAYSER